MMLTSKWMVAAAATVLVGSSVAIGAGIRHKEASNVSAAEPVAAAAPSEVPAADVPAADEPPALTPPDDSARDRRHHGRRHGRHRRGHRGRYGRAHRAAHPAPAFVPSPTNESVGDEFLDDDSMDMEDEADVQE